MMRLPKFEYRAPQTIADAVKIIADAGPAGQFVAGGTDLYPNMKRRQQMPKTVISVMRLAELNQISGDGKSGVNIGASVTLSDICEHPIINRDYPVVARAALTISTPILRNMGTIGGNLLLDTRCNYYDQSEEWRRAIGFCMKRDGAICWVAPSSPRCWAVQSSDGAPVAVASGAHVVLAGPRGTRRIPAAELYHNDGMRYVTKAPDEVLVSYDLPPVGAWRAAYQKLRRRESFDFPVLGVAAWLDLAADGTVRDARIVLGAVASYPMPVPAAAEALVGRRLDDATIGAAADAAFRPAKPMDNTDFTLSWRKEMVRVYVQRALRELASS